MEKEKDKQFFENIKFCDHKKNIEWYCRTCVKLICTNCNHKCIKENDCDDYHTFIKRLDYEISSKINSTLSVLNIFDEITSKKLKIAQKYDSYLLSIFKKMKEKNEEKKMDLINSFNFYSEIKNLNKIKENLQNEINEMNSKKDGDIVKANKEKICEIVENLKNNEIIEIKEIFKKAQESNELIEKKIQEDLTHFDDNVKNLKDLGETIEIDKFYKRFLQDNNTTEGITNNLNTNQFDGFDTLYLDNGKYIGSIKNGSREEKGIMQFSNGNTYFGDFKNNLPNGRGSMIFSDSNIYFGECKNGLADGKGIYLWKKKGNVYNGYWKDDNREGNGSLYYSNGDRYVGYFKKNKRDGKGKMYYKDGDYYDGDFINDKKEGKGIMFYKDGKRYDGEWKNNFIEGIGKLYDKNNNILKNGKWIEGQLETKK